MKTSEKFERRIYQEVYVVDGETTFEYVKKVLEHDSNCAMAHWGLAYVIGPNYNRPWELFDEKELPVVLNESRKSLAAVLDKMGGFHCRTGADQGAQPTLSG